MSSTVLDRLQEEAKSFQTSGGAAGKRRSTGGMSVRAQAKKNYNLTALAAAAEGKADYAKTKRSKPIGDKKAARRSTPTAKLEKDARDFVEKTKSRGRKVKRTLTQVAQSKRSDPLPPSRQPQSKKLEKAARQFVENTPSRGRKKVKRTLTQVAKSKRSDPLPPARQTSAQLTEAAARAFVEDDAAAADAEAPPAKKQRRASGLRASVKGVKDSVKAVKGVLARTLTTVLGTKRASRSS